MDKNIKRTYGILSFIIKVLNEKKFDDINRLKKCINEVLC